MRKRYCSGPAVWAKATEWADGDEKYAAIVKEKPPERYPWLYVSDGVGGEAGDPPIDKAGLMGVLRKWGPK